MKKSVLMLTVLTGSVFFYGCTSADTAREMDRAVNMDRCYAPAASGYAVRMNGSRAKAKSGGKMFELDQNRQMAYTAGFTLTVKNIQDAAAFIKTQAQKYDGYIVSSGSNQVIAKIPVGKADDFVKKLSASGELTDFVMNAEDLTDTITDITVRLDNLRKLRTRLTALLNQAVKVEEILQVEKELNRVTTEIERLTARLQNNQKRVALVTFTIQLQLHTPAVRDRNGVLRYYPFLKNSLCSSTAGSEDKPFFGIELPENFITAAGGRDNVYTAATADDGFLTMQEQDVPDHSTLDFWGGMIARALESYHKYTAVKIRKCTWDGDDALLITAEKNTVSGKIDYMALVALENNFICSDTLKIIEFSGDSDIFAKHQKSLLEKLQVTVNTGK